MKINLKKVKSNYSKIKVILITLILGIFGIDDLYLKKYFRFIFKLAFFVCFITITILAIIELQKAYSIVDRMISYAKERAQWRIDSNEEKYTSAKGAIDLIIEVSREVLDKLISEAITIAATVIIWIFVTFMILVVWLTTLLTTILGFRTDSQGLRIRFSGISFEQFHQELIAQSNN